MSKWKVTFVYEHVVEAEDEDAACDIAAFEEDDWTLADVHLEPVTQEN